MLEDSNFENTNTSSYGDESEKILGTNFKVNGTTYATSLFWQPLRNSDDPYTEIIEAAENVLEGADLFCLKKGRSPQFGLCISEQGYQKGMPAAAVGVVGALSDTSSFLAVFKVDQGWWYVCVRNDVILSDGDMLFYSEQEAKEQFTSMLAVPDWGYKIAPEEWQIEDAKEIPVETLLDGAPRQTLKKVHALRGPKLFAVVAAAALVLIWFLYTLFSLFFMQEPIKPVVPPKTIKKIQPAPPPPEPKPWESTEDPVQVLSYCFKAVQDVVSIPTPGWRIGGVTCTSEGLVTSWRMQIGRLSWMDKALNESGVTFSNKSVSANGREIVVSVPIKKVRTFNSPPTLNAVELVNTLNDLFQGLQMPVSLSTQTWTSPQKNIYRSVKFSFSSKHDPKEWFDVLTKFSGLTLNVIKYDAHSNSWHYEGAIYVL